MRASVMMTLMIVAASGRAVAQPTATAETLFREGKRLMDAGDYAQACEAFEGSLRADPAVSTRLNLGNCREKNQQYASAWGHFLEAMRASRADPTQAGLAKVAEDRAAKLEPRLSHLIINVADEARIEGLVITRDGQPVDPATWNRDLPVDGGSYVIAGKAPGYEPWSTTVKVKAAEDRQAVNVPRFATVTAVGGQPADRSDPDHVDDVAQPDSRWSGKRKLALGAWALGAAGLGAGLAFELKSGATYDEAKASTDNADRRALTDQSNSERRTGIIAAGVGVAAVAAGVYLWLDGKPQGHPDLALVPAPRSDGFAAVLTGRF